MSSSISNWGVSMHKCSHALLKRTFPAVVVILFVGLVLHAQQETASIRGSVTDPSGASIVKAQISAVQIETAHGL